MATKRAIRRRRDPDLPTPSELEWLTGQPQPGSNRFFPYVRGEAKGRRLRALMILYEDRIPPERRAELLADLEWFES